MGEREKERERQHLSSVTTCKLVIRTGLEIKRYAAMGEAQLKHLDSHGVNV